MTKAHDKINEKKKQLETNLARIQEGLDHSIDEVKGGVAESLSPKEIAKKYPLPILGVSIVLGFLLGSKGGFSQKEKSSSNNLVIDSISRSLKKKLTQKAVDTALDFIEGRLKEPKEQ
ncbi:MAG: hypothetical protein BalsKO_16440 [Balneolaceae bacterium]